MAQIPGELQQYKFVSPPSTRTRLTPVGSPSSYLTDPQYARKFTIVWTSAVAAGVVVSLPRLYRSVKQGRIFTGSFGLTESWDPKPYSLAEERQPQEHEKQLKLNVYIRRAWAILCWTLPGFDISVGQSKCRFPSHVE